MNKFVFVALGLVLIVATMARAEPQEPSKYKTMSEALVALSQASDESSKQKVYFEMSLLPLETPDQLVALHKEIMKLEKGTLAPKMDQSVMETRVLSRVFLTAQDPKFAPALSATLDEEYKSIPGYFVGLFKSKEEIDSAGFEMREARLEALTQIIGETKNRGSLPTLRKMVDLKGPARIYAIRAIGRIGDPADLEDFVRRIKQDPKTPFDLSSFGPMAVGRVVIEIDDPTMPDAAKGSIIGSLRYMGTRENISTFRQLLHHKYGNVQEMAAEAICSAAGKDDGDVLIEVIKSKWGTSRILAARAMGKQWDGRFIPVLRNILLHDSSPIVRAVTSQVLADHNVKEAVGDFKKNLNDRNGEVRRAAEKALNQLH